MWWLILTDIVIPGILKRKFSSSQLRGISICDRLLLESQNFLFRRRQVTNTRSVHLALFSMWTFLFHKVLTNIFFKSFLPEQVTGYREWKSNSITNDLKMRTSSDDVRSFLHFQYPPRLPYPCSSTSTYPILEVTQPPYTCRQPTRQPPDNFCCEQWCNHTVQNTGECSPAPYKC